MIKSVNIKTGKKTSRGWTEKELSDMDAARNEDVLRKNNRSYEEKRAEEYPPIGDQLDAIMKWSFTETEITVTEELKSIAAKCMSVKSKYPKPKE